MGYIETFIDRAKQAEIDRLLFHTEEIDRLSVDVLEHRPEFAGTSHEKLIFITGEYQGKSGAAFTEDMNEAEISRLLDIIRQTALANGEPFVETPLTNIPAEDAPAKNGAAEQPFSHPDISAVTEELLAAEDAMYGVSKDIFSAELQFSSQEKTISIRNERGDVMRDHFGNVLLRTTAMAKRDGAVQTAESSRLAARQFGAAAQALEDAANAARMLGSGPCPGGIYAVTLRSSVFSALTAAFLPAFFAQRAQRGMSLLKGRAGSLLANPAVTLRENPCGIINRSFDDEGVPTAPKAVIKNGVLETLLHNRHSAEAEGTASTGNGFRRNYNAAVSTGVTNLTLEGGSLDLAGLLSQMGNGLYITECDGIFAGANPNSGDFSLLSKGYLVERGEMTRPVSRITIGGNFFDLLRRIGAAGAEYAATADPFSNVVRTPPVLIEELRVSGN